MKIIIFIFLLTSSISTIIDYPFGKIKFERFEQESFRVSITGTNDTFVGLLFGKGMKNSDVHVIQFQQSNYTIFDGWSKMYQRPKLDKELNGTDDISNVEFEIVDNKPVITYKRLLKTGDKFDKEIELVLFFNLER
jgi:hypothetical protein